MRSFHSPALAILSGAALALGAFAGSAAAQQADADPALSAPAGGALLAAPSTVAGGQEPASPPTAPLDQEPASELLNLSFTGYAWLTSMSVARVMNGKNMISTTGRRPRAEAPMASPTIAASLTGVSFTLFGPYFCRSP